MLERLKIIKREEKYYLYDPETGESRELVTYVEQDYWASVEFAQ